MTDYAMFTDAGNAAVHAIVMAARENNWTWYTMLDALNKLSKIEAFAEATDTAVRETVYVEAGFEAIV